MIISFLCARFFSSAAWVGAVLKFSFIAQQYSFPAPFSPPLIFALRKRQMFLSVFHFSVFFPFLSGFLCWFLFFRFFFFTSFSLCLFGFLSVSVFSPLFVVFERGAEVFFVFPTRRTYPKGRLSLEIRARSTWLITRGNRKKWLNLLSA